MALKYYFFLNCAISSYDKGLRNYIYKDVNVLELFLIIEKVILEITSLIKKKGQFSIRKGDLCTNAKF